MQDGVLSNDVKLEYVARSYLTSDRWKRSRGIKSKVVGLLVVLEIIV